MTAVAGGAPTSAAGGGPAGRGGGRSRAGWAVAIVVVVVVVLVLIALAAPGRRNDGPPLDPDSTGAKGTRAAVELARRLGADVEVTSELPDAGTDVALTFDDLFSGDAADPIRAWVAAGGTLVLTDPASELAPLATTFERGDPLEDSLEVPRGECTATEPAGLDRLGALEAYGPVARFEVPDGSTACFVDDAGEAVVVVTPLGDGLIVSVSTPWVFTNEALDHGDDAGLFAALAVPEEGTRLSVLVASTDDTGLQAPDDSGSLGLPTGVVLALIQLFVAFVAYCLFRARRLGKPVPEDQQVVIAGSELTRAVGGLLEHAGARDRAATSLRAAARRRLAAAFGLPAGAGAEVVAAAVAARAGLDPDDDGLAALADAPVADDEALAALGRRLDDLLDRVLARSPGARRSAGPPGPGPAAPPSSATPPPSSATPPSSSDRPSPTSPTPPSSPSNLPPTPGGPS